MFSTVGLFVAGGFFAYKIVYPQALTFLVEFSRQFTPMITINEYIESVHDDCARARRGL